MRHPHLVNASAAPANVLLSPWTFIGEGLFLTKRRALGAVIRLAGIDYECLDPDEREAVVRRWTAALNLWDEQHRVYQYVIKSRHPVIPADTPTHPIARAAVADRLAWFNGQRDDLYSFELYVVVLYERWAHPWPLSVREFARAPVATMRTWREHAGTVLEEELDHACLEFRRRLDTWQHHLADLLQPTVLSSSEAYPVLWRLLNYRPDAVPPAFDPALPLDWTLLDAGDIDCYRDHLRTHDQYVRVVTLKRLSRVTWAHHLEPLYAVPGTFIVCSEWQRESTAATHQRLHAEQRHWHAAQVSFLTYLHTRRPQRHEVLVDDSAGAMVSELGEALTAIAVKQHYFGHFALSVVMFDDDVRRLDETSAGVSSALSRMRAVATEERANLLSAWLAIVPGNTDHQIRTMRLLNTNAADLAALFTLDTGDVRHPVSGREYLAVLETTHRSPYFLDLHYHDVGHTLVLGATGAGKSFTLNFLLTHAMKYEPRVMIFDIGGSYRRLTEHFGGSYVKLTLEPRDVTINPFCLPPTRDNLHFVAAFVRVLIGRDRQALTPREEQEIHEQVQSIYSLDPSLRRLATLVDMLPKSLESSLARWVHDGPYATLFDHAVDTLTFADVQTFDLAGLDRYLDVLEPLLYYLLHRASADVLDPQRAQQVKIAVVDEAWRFVRDPRVKAFIREALKTWRKHTAAMWLATQAIEDFTESDLLRTVIESCPNRLFLANSGLDLATYRELFGLNDTTGRLIRDLIPRQQLLLQRPDRSKLLTLRVDDDSRRLYSYSPNVVVPGDVDLPGADGSTRASSPTVHRAVAAAHASVHSDTHTER